MTEFTAEVLPVRADDDHGWELLAWIPEEVKSTLLWLPAMGIAAKHYRPFAEAMAARGVATFVHEWRGNGSSKRRASRQQDWGYAELLDLDLPASESAIAERLPDVVRVIGGHSLGWQLACCRLALAPPSAQRLWLVATGSPYWRAFPASSRYWLPLVYRFLPWLADRRGVLPGRRLGFAGQEARGVIHDWARTALSGRYAAARLETDLERAMQSLDVDVAAVLMRHDWFAPLSSLRFLLSKLGHSQARVDVLDDAALGARADHFEWMKQPEPVVARLVATGKLETS
ncbi:MAG: alpha/beta hydrolase family protein [Lysobacter sp.]